MHLHDLLRSDGHWRLLVFAGDLRQPYQYGRLETLRAKLSLPDSCLHKYMMRSRLNAPQMARRLPKAGELHKVECSDNRLIELITIHSAPRTSINLLDLPSIFYGPWDDDLGWNYWKVYTDDNALREGFEDAYGKWGIDGLRGCLIVVRPDQHVSYVGDLEDIAEVERFFEGCLLATA